MPVLEAVSGLTGITITPVPASRLDDHGISVAGSIANAELLMAILKARAIRRTCGFTKVVMMNVFCKSWLIKKYGGVSLSVLHE